MYALYLKRVLDIACSALTLFILTPLLLLIAVMIRLFDPGPVIFKHERVGRSGNHFMFYKFRTMPVNTRDLASHEIGAINLTWTGRILRRTNLDELPQLINVIKGDMSLIGPRPPIPSQHELIDYRRASGALKCRPGITGLAQVNAYDGMTAKEKAEFDARYAARVTFVTDLRIVAKTLSYLLKPPPTY